VRQRGNTIGCAQREESVIDADRRQRYAESDHDQGPVRPAGPSPATADHAIAARGLDGRMSPAAVLALQRVVGNAEVARLLERERGERSAAGDHGSAQRSADGQAVRRDAMAQVDAVTRTSGRPMPAPVQREMESDFGGEDFGDVRVHIDRGSADAIGAKAYTTKTSHIVFRSAADMDDHTLRHELQHVRQQRTGSVPSGVSEPTDDLERDAERTATELRRGATAGPRPTAASGRRPDGAVQRVSTTNNDFFAQWAGERLNPTQKKWVLDRLGTLTHPDRVRTLRPADALKRLAEKGVTKSVMDAELGSAPSAQVEPVATTESMTEYEKRVGDIVKAENKFWKEKEAEAPTATTVTFDIEGLGRGAVAMLTHPESTHKEMLAWFSHGSENTKPITVDTERKYGFAVKKEKNLDRVGAPADVFASLPDAFARSGIEPTKHAPGLYVSAHHAKEISIEVDRVMGLVKHCDVAVLLNFEWAEEGKLDAAYKEYLEPDYLPGNADDGYRGKSNLRTAETPPLPVIIANADAFKKYRELLLFTCRTPWHVDVLTSGSKDTKEIYRDMLFPVYMEAFKYHDKNDGLTGEQWADRSARMVADQKFAAVPPEKDEVFP
jgi:hypothetical protein